MEKAQELAQKYNSGSGKEKMNVLEKIIKIFLSEFSPAIKERKDWNSLFVVLKKHNENWKEFASLTNGEINPKGFEAYVQNHFPNIPPVVWK